MQRIKRSILLTALLLVFVLAATVAQAAPTAPSGREYAVSITAGGFSPAALDIHPGDTVTWTNNDSGYHNVQADNGEFSSGILSPGDTYSYTFPSGISSEQAFPYGDSLSSSSGVVTVRLHRVFIVMIFKG